ncbi:low molecular weight phosphatase family protein [Streptomyces sp. NBRC 110035]|uniref:arsenate-mycothiol transferase ArsC n=1 Tax=Streptomyces sp. NBRC 110035 TaxID=1547867 RepID=UPI0005AB3B72|nr:low molecular weight phosphatase family protein [Streptomyces sp. NBRC 110035]
MDEQPPLGRATPPLRSASAVLARITARLTVRHRHAFSQATVAQYVNECATLLADRASAVQHLPVLVERFADERLRGLARAQGLSGESPPAVLFVCTENAGRSQLAGALLRRRALGAVMVMTAGSGPAADISPVVVRLLTEQGLDTGEDFPKPLTTEVVDSADLVITLGCADACPVRPGRRYLNWDLPDLSGLDIESARAVRDSLHMRIDRLLAELTESSPSSA